MAEVFQGVTGNLKNRLGNNVFQIKKGRNYVKSLPSFFHDKNSPVQHIYRSRFSQLSSLYLLFKPVIDNYFKPSKKYQTPQNAFISANLSNYCFPPDSDVIDLSKLQISKGFLFPSHLLNPLVSGSTHSYMVETRSIIDNVHSFDLDSGYAILYNVTRNELFRQGFTPPRFVNFFASNILPVSWVQFDVVIIYVFYCTNYLSKLRASSDSSAISVTIGF